MICTLPGFLWKWEKYTIDEAVAQFRREAGKDDEVILLKWRDLFCQRWSLRWFGALVIQIWVSGWWFGTWLLWLSIYWECHNWRTHNFSEGLKPPTRSCWWQETEPLVPTATAELAPGGGGQCLTQQRRDRFSTLVNGERRGCNMDENGSMQILTKTYQDCQLEMAISHYRLALWCKEPRPPLGRFCGCFMFFWWLG